MTILYPGQEWRGKILNTLDEKLADGSKTRTFLLIQTMPQKQL